MPIIFSRYTHIEGVTEMKIKIRDLTNFKELTVPKASVKELTVSKASKVIGGGCPIPDPPELPPPPPIPSIRYR